MKSSKVENILNCNPSMEDLKTFSPFTYYQPFQSTFDPEFATSPPRTPSQMKLWGAAATEKPRGGLQASWDRDAFIPPPHASLGVAPPSTLGDRERRSLCNSTWRGSSSVSQRAPVSAYEGAKSSSNRAMEGTGAYSLFPPADEAMLQTSGSCRPDGFGSLEGTSLRMGNSFSGMQSFTGSRSAYYPLLGSLGRNIAQNINKSGHARPMVCNFCKNNKEVPDIYLNHYLYDPETKVLACPVLRKHVCEICGGTGDQAHTLQYCPVNRERGLQAKVPVLLKTRTITNSTGKIRRN